MDNQDAPLKVIINGQEEEISADDAATFIDKGRKTDELEKKYNTTFDKVWPDYNRSQQELSDARKQLADFSIKQKEGTETKADVQDAKEAAKTLDVDLKDYIRKDDVDKLFDEKYEAREANKQVVSHVLATADQLEKSIDGSDGRPKFNGKAVMAYASSYGFTDKNKSVEQNLQEAYEDMFPEVKSWKDEQLAKEKKASLKTLKGGGEKAPAEVRITKDNFDKALREALG